MFDPTSAVLAQYNFHEYGLCATGTKFDAMGKTYPCKSLTDAINELGHDVIDVVKMARHLGCSLA